MPFNVGQCILIYQMTIITIKWFQQLRHTRFTFKCCSWQCHHVGNQSREKRVRHLARTTKLSYEHIVIVISGWHIPWLNFRVFVLTVFPLPTSHQQEIQGKSQNSYVRIRKKVSYRSNTIAFAHFFHMSSTLRFVCLSAGIWFWK